MEKSIPRIVSSVFTPDEVKTFSQRQDAQQAFPHLSRFRKAHLTTVQISARNGETHTYVVLKQRRKRFLFDIEENTPSLTDTTDDQRKRRLSFTLVVPQQIMRDQGFIAQNEEFREFGSRKSTSRFFRTMEREGYFAMRGYTQDAKSIENNTDFIQPIPALIAKDVGNNILFTVRDSNGANHDYRLSGMIAAPFTMGHSDPSDFGLWRRFLRHGLKQTMYREAAEETALQRGEKTFHIFPHENEHEYRLTVGGILRLRHYYNIKPLGVVYSEDRPVDRVHAGVVFVANQRRKSTSFTLNGSSREIAQILPMSAQQYQEAMAQQELTPASWNGPIIKHELNPTRQRRKD